MQDRVLQCREKVVVYLEFNPEFKLISLAKKRIVDIEEWQSSFSQCYPGKRLVKVTKKPGNAASFECPLR